MGQRDGKFYCALVYGDHSAKQALKSSVWYELVGEEGMYRVLFFFIVSYILLFDHELITQVTPKV